MYPDDYLTDQTERTLAAELIREKVLVHTRDELPYTTAVLIDRFEDAPAEGGLTRIHASILVESESQKPIVIGKGGEMIKRIGTDARRDLEEMLDGKVFLDLHVKVREDWREDERILERDCQDAARGRRQVGRHRRKTALGRKAPADKRPAQGDPGARPLRFGLAGVDAEPVLEREVIAARPAGKGRQVVGAEGGQCTRGVIFGRAKRPIRLPLEQHHLVGPDAPVRQDRSGGRYERELGDFENPKALHYLGCHDLLSCGRYQIRSMMVAGAMPPAAHMVMSA